MNPLGPLNLQGLAGLGVALGLGALLLTAKAETRHWRKQSSQFEQLYRSEQAALARTVADYRAAAETARAADRAAADRVRAEQRGINERTVHDYQMRLAAARDRARRLQLAAAPAATDPCGSRAAPVPGVSAAACGAVEAPGQDGLSSADALIATEQAIQLDELIRWVERQARIDPNGEANPRR